MAWVFDTRRDSSTLSGGTNAARESKWKAWPTWVGTSLENWVALGAGVDSRRLHFFASLLRGVTLAKASERGLWPRAALVATNSKIHSVDFGIGGRLPLLPRRKRQLEKASDFLSQTVRVYLTPRPGRLRQPKSHLPGRIRNVFYLQLRKVASMYSPRS